MLIGVFSPGEIMSLIFVTGFMIIHSVSRFFDPAGSLFFRVKKPTTRKLIIFFYRSYLGDGFIGHNK